MPAKPFMKLFKADWQAEPTLKLCSWEAGYLWFQMCMLMDGADDYGYLKAGKKPMTEADLATILGAPLERVRTCLFELETKGVFSRNRAGCIYSRRMIKGSKSRDNGKMGGNPNLGKDKEISGQVGPSSKLESRVYTEEKEKEKEESPLPPKRGESGENEFDEWFHEKFWKPFPKLRAGSRDKARAAMTKALKKTNREEIENAVREYAESDEVARGYAKGAAAWLNDERWTTVYRSANSEHQKPQTSGMGKIAAISEKARALVLANLDADSSQAWNQDHQPETGGYPRQLPAGPAQEPNRNCENVRPQGPGDGPDIIPPSRNGEND